MMRGEGRDAGSRGGGREGDRASGATRVPGVARGAAWGEAVCKVCNLESVPNIFAVDVPDGLMGKCSV